MPMVDFADGGVERGGLAAAGGSGDQQHAVGFAGKPAHIGHVALIEAKVVQAQPLDLVAQGLLVKNPDHRVFAEDARHDRNPAVHFAAVHADFEAPVLRHAALRNVEFGHHLDARHDLLGNFGTRERDRCGQHAIDPVLDCQTGGIALDMDVAGLEPEGVVQG